MAQSTSEVVFFSSYLNETTSEENASPSAHTHMRAYITAHSCFYPSLPSPPWPSSHNHHLRWRIRKNNAFTHNPLSDKRIAPPVKEVKEKNTFCKGCARARARISLPESICRAPILSTKKVFPNVEWGYLKNFYRTVIKKSYLCHYTTNFTTKTRCEKKKSTALWTAKLPFSSFW